MDIKKQITCLILFCFLFANIGCATRGAFVYSPLSQFKETKKFPARIAVKEFLDKRGNDNKDYTMLYIIPLVPYGIEKYNRPEAGGRFITQSAYQFRPSEDFAKAMVMDLKASNMFEEVFYSEREHPKDVEFILEGTIISTNYEGKLISYCISFFASYLWFFGLPVGHSINEVNLDIRLVTAKEGKIIWQNSYDKQTSQVGGLYYNLYQYCKGYPKMIEEINRDVIVSIEKELINKPQEFWTLIRVGAN